MRNFVILFFVAAISPTVSAQQTWNLQHCVEHALKNNISLKQAEVSAAMSEVNATQSKASMLPSLNAGANHTYNIGRRIDPYTNQFASNAVLSQNFYMSAQVTLWSGLTQYNNMRQNYYTWLSNCQNFEQQKNDLSLAVASSFLQVVYNKEMMKVSESQVKISKEQLDRSEKLAEAGSLARATVYDVKAQLANDEYTYTSALNNYQLSLLGLKQLLNLDSVKNFEIEKPNLDDVAIDLAHLSVSDVYETALKNQASIKGAAYALQASEKGLDAAKGRISPSLSFGASIGTGYSGLAKDIIGVTPTGFQAIGQTSAGVMVYAPTYDYVTKSTPFKDQFHDNVNKSIGFTLNMPLFNGLQTYSGIKNSELQLLNARYSLDLKKQQLFKIITQAYADAQAAMNKYAAAKSAFAASQESFNYAQQKFNNGAISSFDFNTAKNRLLKSQADALNAKFDFIFKTKVLDFYQGKPLTF